MRYYFNYKLENGSYIYKESDSFRELYKTAVAEMLEAADEWPLYTTEHLFIVDGLTDKCAAVLTGRAKLSPDMHDIIGEIRIRRSRQDTVRQPDIVRTFWLGSYGSYDNIEVIG